MKIANKTIQYSIYQRDNGKADYIGDTASYTRPDIETMTDTIAGAGLMGEVDMPTPGQIGSMEGEITFNKTNEKFVKLFSPRAKTIEVRWVNDSIDSSNANVSMTANKEIMTIMPKTASLGDIEGNATNEATLSFEVLYYQYFIDGKPILEIDKLNNIFKVDGVDYSAEIRNAL